MTALDAVTQRLIALAIEEDLAGGDATAAATVPSQLTGSASFVTRGRGVVAGLPAVAFVATTVDRTLDVRPTVRDGDTVEPGEVLARVRGPARSILAVERTSLNLLTHLSGVATHTARYVEAVAGTGCAVRDTRKTLPGMRALQKSAVVSGGGVNHRFSLGDGLLVKDNHVAAAGGVDAATRQALAHAADLPVQVEVDTLAQLEQALDAGATSVLLDNFDVEQMRQAVQRCRARPAPVFVEVSGNVTLDTVRTIAQTGVDAVAVGALTHSVSALDIGLDWDDAPAEGT